MWTSPCCSVDRRKSATISPPMMKLVILSALVSSVCCTQVGPSSKQAPTHALHPPSPVQNNGNSRPATASRRSLTPAADPLDTHLDRIFANLDEKNGKEDSSVWDRIKRNFIDQDRSGGGGSLFSKTMDNILHPLQGKQQQSTRRTLWKKKEGTLLKPLWLAKVYEGTIVGAKAAVKVIEKKYGISLLMAQLSPIMDLVPRIPKLINRVFPLLDLVERLELTLINPAEGLFNQLQPLIHRYLPRVPRLLQQVEQINVVGLAKKAENLLDRVGKVPIERLVEIVFNLTADLKSITDLVKQAQQLIPSILPLFLGGGNRGGSRPSSTSSSSSSSSSQSSSSSSTQGDETVFFPPLDDEEEDDRPASSTTARPKANGSPTTATTEAPKITMMVIDQELLKKFDPEFIRKLQPKVLQNINPALLNVLTPEIIEALDADKLNQLEPRVLKSLRPEFVKLVSPALLKAIPPALLNALPDDLLRDFDPKLLEGLDPSLLESLDPSFLASLDADTIRSFLAPDSSRRQDKGKVQFISTPQGRTEEFVKALVQVLAASGAQVHYRYIH